VAEIMAATLYKAHDMLSSVSKPTAEAGSTSSKSKTLSVGAIEKDSASVATRQRPQVLLAGQMQIRKV
jgi:hypothetical protein